MERAHVQEFEEQCGQMQELGRRLKEYMERHDKELAEKTELIESMRRLINDHRCKEAAEAEQKQREREQQAAEVRRAVEAGVEGVKSKYEERIRGMELGYLAVVHELKEQLRSVRKEAARSISDRRVSVGGSTISSGRRHSSARASRVSSSRNGKE